MIIAGKRLQYLSAIILFIQIPHWLHYYMDNYSTIIPNGKSSKSCDITTYLANYYMVSYILMVLLLQGMIHHSLVNC